MKNARKGFLSIAKIKIGVKFTQITEIFAVINSLFAKGS